jgi:hypothetical protein
VIAYAITMIAPAIRLSGKDASESAAPRSRGMNPRLEGSHRLSQLTKSSRLLPCSLRLLGELERWRFSMFPSPKRPAPAK